MKSPPARREAANLPPLDEAARARVVEHLHLARRLGWRYFRYSARSVPLDELRGEALYALSYAAGMFDGRRGVPFGAYATMVISHRLIHAIKRWQRGRRPAPLCFADLAAAEPDAPCPRSRESGDEAALREAAELIRRCLPPRWFRALQLYYAQGHTLVEVGRRLGVTRERVRQIITKAVLRVKRRVPLYGWVNGWQRELA